MALNPAPRVKNAARLVGASWFLVVSLAASRVAAEAGEDGWARVVEATRRLNLGDFAGAERALDAVPANHAAAADAAQVRRALERAMATRASSTALARSDDVPFDANQSSVSLSAWASPRLQLTANAEAIALRGTKRLTALGARGSLRLRVGEADADLVAELGGRFWSDTGKFAIGGIGGELFPTGPLRWKLGHFRDEELGNLASAEWHILRDTLYANVELKDFQRVNATARLEGTRYSDDNAALLAYAWATYTFEFSFVRAELGYAGAYRDTRYSRWSPTSGYFPYITPMEAVRHGPLGSVSFRMHWFELGGSAAIAAFASEVDPSTYGYFYSRRDTIYHEARAYLRIGGNESAIQAAYEVLQDGYYYTLRTISLSAFISL
jgi:hypothetical protein